MNDTTSKERPILFSAPMVRAILAGHKTQTRRIVKPVKGYEHNNILKYGMPYAADPWAVWWHGKSDHVGCLQECPYGVPGDRLWVRETFQAFGPPCDGELSYPLKYIPPYKGNYVALYGADGEDGPWRPSIAEAVKKP